MTAFQAFSSSVPFNLYINYEFRKTSYKSVSKIEIYKYVENMIFEGLDLESLLCGRVIVNNFIDISGF